MKIIGCSAVVLLAGLLWEARANKCQTGDEEAKYLPRVLGRPYSSIRTPFIMPCDTMEVRLGDTCTIHPGVMLHFGPNSSSSNVILVQGHLEALGSDEAPVYFSGTLADGDFGFRPGEGSWGGFRIDPVGSAQFQHVRIFRAVPALESKSERVQLRKVVFKNSLEVSGPNGKRLDLDFKETTVQSLDFSPPAAAAAETSNPKGADDVKGSRTKPLAWSLIGGGTLLAGAGLFWYLSDSEENPPGPSGSQIEYPEKPSFPSP